MKYNVMAEAIFLEILKELTTLEKQGVLTLNPTILIAHISGLFQGLLEIGSGYSPTLTSELFSKTLSSAPEESINPPEKQEAPLRKKRKMYRGYKPFSET